MSSAGSYANQASIPNSTACREPTPREGPVRQDSRRKPKVGEELEVLVYPPNLRELALELPRSYRERALTHFENQAIDLSDPSDWELDEIQTYLINQASIYRRKAGYVKAHSQRRRVAAWEAKQEALLAEELEIDLGPLVVHSDPLTKDTVDHAVDSVMKYVNKKLGR